MSGFGNLRDEFAATGEGDSVMLRPKKPMGTVTSVEVTLNARGFPIRSFRIPDSRGNVIMIELSDVVVNSGLNERLFDLTLPPGVSVFDR